MSFYKELKRRNVLRVGAAYAVASWLVIQVVETILPAFGFGEAAVRVTTIVLAIGFVPVLIFAWAFELTPEGLKREKDIDRSQSITPRTGKKLDRMIMVVLALALGYFAFDKFVLAPRREATQLDAVAEAARAEGRSEAIVESYGDMSIAVLPFTDMSAAHDQEYMADGLAEELLNLLAQIPQLRVISRSSAFSFKGQNLGIPEIARQLNVAHILEGSVRSAGNTIRVTAQLIEAQTDTHLWSATYDRPLDDIFAMQDEIASAVVTQLKLKLLGAAPRARQTDPEAYALVLQARALARKFTPEGFEQAIVLAQQALARDPGLVAAWDQLASIYSDQADRGLRSVTEGYHLARQAEEQALALDPDYAPAHAGLGWISMSHDGDLTQAARHFQRALALAPSDTGILSNAASLALSLGRLDRAIAIDEYVVTRDPVNPFHHFSLGYSYFCAGRPERALGRLRSALQLAPDFVVAHYLIGQVLLRKGDAEAALEETLQEPDVTYRLLGLAMTYHALGRQTESDAALNELIREFGSDWPYNIAYVLADRGEADRAFEWLDKAVVSRDTGLSEIVVEPGFAKLRVDPRWLPFLESIGKSPELLEAIPLEVKLPQ